MSLVTHPFQHFSQTDHAGTLEELDGKVSVGGRNITNLRFADEIDAVAEEEQTGAGSLSRSVDKTGKKHKLEISAKKTKLMTNSANVIQ